ncbi:tripartite tricarboxylate transporter substrate binding protein [Verticiella sediminum]|uniref:Tripartite tricarboxylate transporter substrate binding protein n=1 Tax=Verticiella sediminum TaxID=1247510 RepID=A0A556ABG0_9BURK|nr:tripartite tricarboxylate transporter substrate binding protein [Verticiella sediminum]TSH90232.1 tripartite tricarboxylate transporter substrate binding protein [Verticiella sediminum]
MASKTLVRLRTRLCTHVALALTLIAPGAAFAKWPERPLQLVVGFAPGGPNDIMARVLAEQLSAQLAQPVIVDNRPGANGNIAAGYVANAAPDGYTLLYNSSSLGLSPALYRNLPADPLRDLAPVNGTATLPLVMVVNKDFPASNFEEWVAQVKARPGGFNYGSPGIGNLAHIGMEMILKDRGLEAVHVPYKGSSEARSAVVAGMVQFQLDSVNSALGLIEAGSLKPIVITAQNGSEVLPEVGTLQASGVEGIELSGWQGVMAPARTPPDVIAKLSEEIALAMKSPKIVEALEVQGGYSIASTAQEYGEFLAQQIELFKTTVQDIGLEPN